MIIKERCSILFILLIPLYGSGQTSSVLKDGDWYKISVIEKGIYRLDYNYLQDIGVPVNSIDPNTFQIFGNGGGGPLPQSNSAPRPTDLLENAIVVDDGNDGSFDPGDFLLFFGNTSDRISFNTDSETFDYQDNTFTDTVHYFLTWGQAEGKRITTIDPPQGAVDETFVYSYSIHDIDEFNLLNSGRLWLGENFEQSGRSVTVQLKAPFFSPLSSQVIKVLAMGASLAPTQFILDVGGATLGSLSTPAKPGSGSLTRGFLRDTVFQVPEASVSDQLMINIRFETGHTEGFGFLDYLLLTTKSALTYSGESFGFTTAPMAQPSTFSIDGFQSGLVLWDVSDAVSPVRMGLNSTGKFSVFNDEAAHYYLFHPQHALVPAGSWAIPNQNLHALSEPEFLIITVPGFVQEALRLGEHRSTHSGLTYQVVTTNEIYNEFSSGSLDVTAIRDFIKHLSGQRALKYVLLFGDASYDYKDRIPENTNFVPTYQSINSLNRTLTYSSDDYYGFLEDDEGLWEEVASDEPTLDVSIGRIPVKTREEAMIAVDKIIHYDTRSDFGPWRTTMIFSADDGDENLHHRDTDLLAEFADRNYGFVRIDKLYLDAFPQEDQFSEAAHKAFHSKVHEGALVIDYMGHGNEFQLAQERLVTDFDIRSWKNLDRLPFFVTATCEFGVFDNPAWVSAGERLILEPDGGAIGLITATRLVYTNSNFQLNSAFTQEVFKKGQGGFPTIGEIFLRMKNRSISGVNNRNYVLLGDPSMTLKYPEYEVRIDSVKDLAGQPVTVFESFREARIDGTIINQTGSAITDFNGQVTLSFYDDLTEEKTLGDENEPFTYRDRNSLLFQGIGTIKDGKFNINVLLPDGISSATDEAKMTFYASDISLGRDASGGLVNVSVIHGGNPPLDFDPPGITIFVGDTLFKSGGLVARNSELMVRLTDESGINLSSLKPENRLFGKLNGIEIPLNEYYSTNPDTYKSGRVHYSFSNLVPGNYTFTMNASDILGNRSSETITFQVLASPELPINNFKAYPNPSDGDVHFSFIHNRSGEDIYLEYRIFNLLGVEVFVHDQTITNAPVTIEVKPWSEDDQLARGLDTGLYIYRFYIRALRDGADKVLSGRIVLQ